MAPQNAGHRLDSLVCHNDSRVKAMKSSHRPGAGGRPPGKFRPGASGAADKRKPLRPFGKPTGKKKKPAAAATGEIRPPRLQQVLAGAGLGSRRQCETLITEGRVEVDGVVVEQLGTRVDLATQKVLVDGEPLRMERPQYFMLNKPPGVVSTTRDPSGRPRVIDLIKTDVRVYNVGRLDRTSEGLIIVTNDGELANRLTHPSFEMEKRYLVEVFGAPSREQLEQLEKGIHLAEGVAKASRVQARRATRRGTILEITLREGRNREIRRLMASVGHKVLRLKRIAIGPIVLGELGAGESRKLTVEEIAMLKGLAGKSSASSHGNRSRKKDLTEQIMLSDFRGHAKKAAKKRADQKLATKTPSLGRALSRQMVARSKDGSAKRSAGPVRPPRRGPASDRTESGSGPRSGPARGARHGEASRGSERPDRKFSPRGEGPTGRFGDKAVRSPRRERTAGGSERKRAGGMPENRGPGRGSRPDRNSGPPPSSPANERSLRRARRDIPGRPPAEDDDD